MPRYELLAGHERLPARPFTDPEHTLADAAVMNRMLERLRREARAWPSCRMSVEALEHTRAGCRHWLVVPSAPALSAAEDVTVVGFFGDQRPGMDHSAIYQLEADVVARLGRYAPVGLLGYYDAEVAPGVHGNLVLFATHKVPSKWHRDLVHAKAVALTPRHYSIVRLHRGIICGALLDRGHLIIKQTRYFDFGHHPAWRGLRRFELGRGNRRSHRSAQSTSPEPDVRGAVTCATDTPLGALCGLSYAAARQTRIRVWAAMVAAVLVSRPQKV